MANITLRDALRSQDVTRWNIVRHDRRQSVAEHSFNVALIAMRYCEVLGLGEDLRAKVALHAITHDLTEVYYGEIPSITKDLLAPELRQRVHDLEAGASFCGLQVAANDRVIADVVKLADLTEAVVYITAFGRGEHAEEVARRLRHTLYIMGGDLAEQILYEAVRGDQQTLDSVAGAPGDCPRPISWITERRLEGNAPRETQSGVVPDSWAQTFNQWRSAPPSLEAADAV